MLRGINPIPSAEINYGNRGDGLRMTLGPLLSWEVFFIDISQKELG